jgi:hypothetical protein
MTSIPSTLLLRWRYVSRSGVVSLGLMSTMRGATSSEDGCRLRCFRFNCRSFLLLAFVVFRRRNDFVVSAAIKTTIPAMCSVVHTLLNKKKLKKSVIAFRAVLVMDIVSAPKFLVIAAEHDDPKKPMELNKIIMRILLDTDHVRSSKGTPSKYCW